MRRDGDEWRLALPAGLLSAASAVSLRVQDAEKAPILDGTFSRPRWRRDGDGQRTELQRGDLLNVAATFDGINETRNQLLGEKKAG